MRERKHCFQFLTYSGYFIQTAGGRRILVDPFLDDNDGIGLTSEDFPSVDLILVTHGAYDHVGDAGKIALRCGSWVVCPDDVKALLLEQSVPEDRIIAVPWGMTVDFGSIQVKPLECHHRTVVQLRSGGYISSQPLAFLLCLEDGTRVYIAGDTALFGDMKLQGELYRPHIGLINAVTDAWEKPRKDGAPQIRDGEMTPYEAALCAKWLGVKLALPCHYIDPDANPQVREFVDALDGLNKRSPFHTDCAVLRGGERYFCDIKDFEE